MSIDKSKWGHIPGNTGPAPVARQAPAQEPVEAETAKRRAEMQERAAQSASWWDDARTSALAAESESHGYEQPYIPDGSQQLQKQGGLSTNIAPGGADRYVRHEENNVVPEGTQSPVMRWAKNR